MRPPAVALAFSLCAALLLGMVLTGPAYSAGTHGMAVSAVIVSKNQCKFTNNGPTALPFGNIDPSSSSTAVASASTTFSCKGKDSSATYYVTSNDGLNAASPGNPRLVHALNPSEYLAYTLNFPQSATVPKNTTQTLTIQGFIQPSAYQNARGGSYADTVTLTIEP